MKSEEMTVEKKIGGEPFEEHAPVKYSPLLKGVEQSVRKSTTLCSISSTVVLLACITVREGVRLALSYGIPPLNITYGSLQGNTKRVDSVIQHLAKTKTLSGPRQ